MSRKLFRDPLTFLDLPRSTDFVDANVAILGIPFDCARDLTRFGPRQGPNAVRHASVLTRNLMEDADPFPLDSITVIDAGNVDLPMDDIDEAFAQIEAAMDSILQADCIPIAVGGDGSVSLPQMRSLHRKHGEFALLHFDAHTDTWEVPELGRHSNANQFTFANTEALIDMQAAVHIGTRGPINASRNIRYAKSLGYRVIPFSKFRSMGCQELLSSVKQTVGERPVFICYDMDFFDPSVAPGVATPTPGGAMPEEGLELMRGLKGLNIIGIDINTMTPLHDAGDATAILAASLLAEGLGILSK
jgi:agmatinase